jgi:hypothetical protein
LALAWPAASVPNEVELRRASEVIDLLKSNYVDADKLDGKLLNDATVAGILQALGAGATIIDAGTNDVTAAGASGARAPLARAEIIDPDIGYIRLGDVTPATAAALDAELKKFNDAHVAGFVLDVRFADGDDYEAAATVCCRFLGEDQHLFGIKSSGSDVRVFRSGACATDLGAALKPLQEAPLLVLINRETRGSAEALAGALRAHNRAILVGNRTAGTPAKTQELPLGDGRRLRVATAKLLLPADETKDALTVDVFPKGLAPDIAVTIDAQVERDAVLNAPAEMTLTASLEPKLVKRRFAEAELVRVFRGEALDLALPASQTNVTTAPKLFNEESLVVDEAPATTEPEEPDAETTEKKDETEVQAVQDVVLQRAVDVLKGIRTLLSWR